MSKQTTSAKTTAAQAMISQKIRDGEVEYSVQVLPLADLLADRAYSRPVGAALVKQIATNFDPKVAGFPLVNRRSDGVLALLDGNHRRQAMMRCGIKYWPCHVTNGLLIAEEASIFHARNTYIKRARAVERYRADILRQDETTIKITDLLNDLGLFISPHSTPSSDRSIVAVTALYNIYNRRGEDFLRKVLTLAKSTWPENHRAFAQVLLYAVEMFMNKHPEFKRERFIHKLSKTKPTDLADRARSLARIGGAHEVTNMYNILRASYNEGLRSNRLPE